jgi:drug/metabolite transporter (DMT)-like permease
MIAILSCAPRIDRPRDRDRQAVFSTVAPLWLMAEGLKRVGANQVSPVACIGPIATIALAAAFLGEPVTRVQLVGAALVLAGVIIIGVRPKAARTPDKTAGP